MIISYMHILLYFATIIICTGHSTNSNTCKRGFIYQFSNCINENHLNSSTSMQTNFNEETFYTKVDHFKPQDARKIVFHYHSNTNYLENNGPLFFLINDAIIGTEQYIENGLMVDVARELGGALFTYDHRYYGLNIPTPTASFADLQYFTIEQNLADIATLIFTVKKRLNRQHSNIIVFGPGYGGTLATWAKHKYPHLIDIAWASSGLILPSTISPHYVIAMNEIFSHYGGDKCYDNIKEAFQTLEDLTNNHDDVQIQNAFNLCYPLNTTNNNQDDKGMFLFLTMDILSYYFALNGIHGMNTFCRALEAIPNNPFESFARWFRFHFTISYCMDVNYDNMINFFSNEEWNQLGYYARLRQWFYKSCTQFGYLAITYPETVFPDWIPEEFYINTCQRVLGENYDYTKLERANNNLRIIHGDYIIPSTKYMFTNGKFDPMFGRGLTNIYHTEQKNAYVINISYGQRSADFGSVVNWEPAPITEAKQQIKYMIKQWVINVEYN